jgi:hypothetical protein
LIYIIECYKKKEGLEMLSEEEKNIIFRNLRIEG